jgi:hypothetical protein
MYFKFCPRTILTHQIRDYQTLTLLIDNLEKAKVDHMS